ncbi:MAG: glycoside hydrolase family 127 protein [Bacteroidales bacterium]|nr:glycoside hydrolase family 127 protein [Bacteroidales bacterium]
MNRIKVIFIAAAFLLTSPAFSQKGSVAVKDVLEPLPGGNAKMEGYFDDDILLVQENWAKGVMPYDEVIEFFRSGRTKFALGEMPGKSIRTNSLLWRYTRDPQLKALTKGVVYSLIATAKENGSISCTPVDKQPGEHDGDIWERKYVLLGLSQYYLDVEKDPLVLEAMEKEARSVMDQVGPAPKKSIIELGWSSTNIESSSILEPFMRLYFITGKKEYLDFATYIIEAGGCKGSNIFTQIHDGVPMTEVGAPYPKAYEMTSIWEGLVEYYRATGDPKWLRCIRNFFEEVKDNEISIIGNGGADVYWPKLMGEGWSNTAVEQSNPDIRRMMETCVGVTWIKFCSQYLRLTGDPAAVDCIEKYVYNGLLGAMRPDGKGFSYVNLLNGPKVTNSGWGMVIDGLPVTCCNLSGPTGLAYIPYVAVMQGEEGPVVNLYNRGVFKSKTSDGRYVSLGIDTEFPREGDVKIAVFPSGEGEFSIRLHIPSWSESTTVNVNGKPVKDVISGTYLEIKRDWKPGDEIRISFDMKARIIPARDGRNPAGKNFQALQWGPLVLARDENIDQSYNEPVRIVAGEDGVVDVTRVKPQRKGTRVQFMVPTTDGPIPMVDYSSVDCWEGKHVQTWLPIK